MIDNDLIINIDSIDEIYMNNCTIQFLYKNILHKQDAKNMLQYLLLSVL